jgi:hypothetical protein
MTMPAYRLGSIALKPRRAADLEDLADRFEGLNEETLAELRGPRREIARLRAIDSAF